MKMPLEGGTVTMLASAATAGGPVGNLAVDATSAYWGSLICTPVAGCNDGALMKLTPK
jgi:hypothetical protein